MVITGQANTATAMQVAMVTISDSTSKAFRARGGNSEMTTSMRIWRPSQPAWLAPRNTQPIIRNSIASSAQYNDTEKK